MKDNWKIVKVKMNFRIRPPTDEIIQLKNVILHVVENCEPKIVLHMVQNWEQKSLLHVAGIWEPKSMLH